MSKPDASQEAWDAAKAVLAIYDIRPTDTNVEPMYRAILAAKAEERENCAVEAEAFAARMKQFIKPERSDAKNAPFDSALGAAHEVAAAIRKRGEG